MIDLFQRFKTTVQIGNITKAAEELRISQPALSFSIKELEKYFNAKLLIRAKDGIHLTEVGKIIFDYAIQVSEDLNTVREKIKFQTKARDTNITVGMIDNVGSKTLGMIYSNFLKENPSISISIFIDNTATLIDLVMKDKIDFAIITNPQIKINSELNIEEFVKEKLILVGIPEIAAEIRNKLDLQNHLFITYNQGSNSFRLINKKLKELEISANYSVFSTNPELIKELILNGSGIGYLPENLVKEKVQQEKLQKISIENADLERNLSLIYKKKKYLSDVKLRFIEKMKEI